MMTIQHQHFVGRRSIWMTFILLAFALGSVACGDSDGGGGGGVDPNGPNPEAPKSFGDTCIDDEELCIDGTECRTYGAGTDDRFCTIQCGSDDDCPKDSACLSLSSASGLVKLCVPDDLCIDPDEDEYGSGPGCKGPDCDQSNPNINPGAPEICDGLDNNCSGNIDDNAVDVNYPCDTPYEGVCAEGWTICKDAAVECEPNVYPNERREICDGLDNDCDGLVDEGPDDGDENNNLVVGIGRHCGNPDSDCYSGIQFCNADTKSLECDTPVGVLDVLDLCDGIDNNCDGEIDEDANDPNNLLGTPCYDGIGTCRAAATWGCDPDDPAAEPVCAAEARMENKEPEVCDYTDNDCDGVVDNGFVNANGVYNGIENCGQCGNDCARRIAGDGGNPADLGLSVTCKVTGSSAACSSECLPGHYDLDQVPANGCEFQPDLNAIYVAKEIRDGTEGEDTGSCGVFSSPCRTITHAIGRANSANKARVRVAEGIFKEALTLQNGISVLGGHSSRNWEPDPTANTTTLQGGIFMSNHVATVIASNITSTTEFSGFTIDARDAQAGGNSYGIYIKNSTNALTVKDNVVIGGRGGVGAAANNGDSGQTGGDGVTGADRSNYNASCSDRSNPPVLAGGAGGANTCGGQNVSGGHGTHITRCPDGQNVITNENGARGQSGFGTGSGTGGESSKHTTNGDITNGVYSCSSGYGVSTPGSAGGAGGNGNAGAASGAANGSASGDHWQGAPGQSGGSGTAGAGGGGAGSSGGIKEPNSGSSNAKGQSHYGPTGGGGGAGGCGGNGGTGGHAGGASFGIFVTFSGNTSSVPNIRDNEITRGDGGRGGAGGAGGSGGSGGAGGEGGAMSADTGNWTRCGQNGQRGGPGGAGGHGGGGGGGTGGASFDIATAGNSNNAVNAYQTNNTFTRNASDATGGQGGVGGSSMVNNGNTGTQGASGNFRRF